MSPFPPISDYGLIGDTTSVALINKQASIDWLCWPRFDSPAVFLALLDRDKGGRCDLALRGGALPAELIFVRRRYEPGTLVLETVLRAGDAELTVTDFMPVRARPGVTDDDDTDLLADNRVIRKLTCSGGPLPLRVTVWPTFDYADPAAGVGRIAPLGNPPNNPPIRMHPPKVEQKLGHFYVEASVFPDFDSETGKLWVDLDLKNGDSAWISLTEGEFGRLDPLKSQRDIDRLLAATRDYWKGWLSRCGDFGEFSEPVCRSLITLKALTYSPTGAIVAAPTMALPEAIGHNRNYDYRYCWTRDASFTVRAFLMAGYNREARAFLRFLVNANTQDGKDLPVMLGLDGVPPSGNERNLDYLSGYRDSRPVTVGNVAADQNQHDGWGEVIHSLYSYFEMSQQVPPAGSKGRQHLAETVYNMAECAASSWQKPDRGIWEWRGKQQHFFHSQAMCWLALDRAAKIADRIDLSQHKEHWIAVADEIRRSVLDQGWNRKMGAYTQSAESEFLDASVLRTALLGFMDMHDPRPAATLARIRQKLSAPENLDLYYRYIADDGLDGKEGTFTSCAFWVADCMAMGGQVEPARAMMHRLLQRGNDLGLFSEELDPRDGSALGNFPQAFTHMCIVNGTHRLLEVMKQAAAPK